MTEVKPLTQEQRKEFIQLLKDAKDRAIERFSESWSKRYAKAKEAAQESLLKRIGADELTKKRKEAKKMLKDSEHALGTLGISFGLSDAPRFNDDVDDEYQEEIREQAASVLAAQKEEVLRGYEKAILNVLAAEGVQDAKGIVEPLV